jgi:hypothetical protein
MRYRLGGGTLGQINLTWPLASLELGVDTVSVSPRGLLRRFLRPVVMPLVEITKVETNFGHTHAGIRFRVDDPADGTVFWATSSTKPAVVAALERLGAAQPPWAGRVLGNVPRAEPRCTAA